MWRDANGNGLRDTDESEGVGGVAVQLWRGDGKDEELIARTHTTTAAEDPSHVGTYQFPNVPAGAGYTVVVTLPDGTAESAGFTVPADGAPTEANNDSDVSREGRSAAFSVDGDDVSVDAGIARASLSGVAYLDADGDGQRDQDPAGVLEPPAQQPVTVTLTLADEDGTPVPKATPLTAKTDADGAYRFEDLAPGHYVLMARTTSGLPVVGPPKGRTVVLVERGRQQHLNLVLEDGNPR